MSRERSGPCPVLVVASEDWPAAVMVLRVKNKFLSTFQHAGRMRSERECREARRLQCGLRRARERGPTSRQKLSTDKFDLEVAQNTTPVRHSGYL